MTESYTYHGFTTGETVVVPAGYEATVTYPGRRPIPERVYVRTENLTEHFHYSELRRPEPELCDHVGTERHERTRTGYLNDFPRGFVETLCAECGAEVEPEKSAYVDGFELGDEVRFVLEPNGSNGVLRSLDDARVGFVGWVGRDVLARFEGPHPIARLEDWFLVSVARADVNLNENVELEPEVERLFVPVHRSGIELAR